MPRPGLFGVTASVVGLEERHPAADVNRDGTLTKLEWTAFLATMVSWKRAAVSKPGAADR
jgi:hypothetical protein